MKFDDEQLASLFTCLFEGLGAKSWTTMLEQGGRFEVDYVTGTARLFPGQTLERPQVVQDMATNATLRISICLAVDDEAGIARLDGADVEIVRERFRAEIGAWIRVIRYIEEDLAKQKPPKYVICLPRQAAQELQSHLMRGEPRMPH
ncbi:hypothetical protein [Variovorax sp. KK3]|uniref:hypothetical protein n=1 Tax=Variovorax sp. KK3 TaxID=1855728 RepID=UPI00097BF7AA|nr:hypothetical protein [Variovorax sp. KK3]